MVLAIGDLVGDTVVTLLAATATQFALAGRLWTIEIEVAVTGAVIALPLWYPSGHPEIPGGQLCQPQS
jgi:hypothetical protein